MASKAASRAARGAWRKPAPSRATQHRSRWKAPSLVRGLRARVVAGPARSSADPAGDTAGIIDELPGATESVSPWVWRIALLLCVLGLADASYLTAAHYTTSAILACSDKGTVNCLKVTTSPQSVIFGIPVAVLGLAYFVAMTPLQLPVSWRSPSMWLRWLRLAGVVSGVGMVAYLIYTELFTLRAICLYCTGVHIVTVLLFLTVMVGTALAPRPDEIPSTLT